MDIKGFTEYLSLDPQRSHHTVRAYESDLRRFFKFLKRRRLQVGEVTPKVFHQYLEHLRASKNPRTGAIGMSTATLARHVSAIRKYFEYARGTSFPDLKNPAYGVRVGKPGNDECKAPSESDLETLLKGVTVLRDRVLFSLFIASGLRLAELHQLNKSSIEVEERTDEDGELRVLGTGEVIGKRRKKRRFFFDAQTLSLIGAYLKSRNDQDPALFVSERRQRMSKRAMQDTLARWCRKLGLTHLHVHQLRHAFATRMANTNMDSMILKTLMGHDDLRTTNRYFKLHDHTVARQYFAAMEFRKARH